jgi:7-cyano-7-deazaguanine tRNA-ribosyltransferase
MVSSVGRGIAAAGIEGYQWSEPGTEEKVVLVIAGLSLKNLKPRVWDSESPYFLKKLRAVMLSYADFHQMPSRRRQAMEQGLHKYLEIPSDIKIYLDNGAFFFLGREGETPSAEYEEFIQQARPDWWPIPQDFIPTPQMTKDAQQDCLQRTMANNLRYEQDGFVPVIHISQVLAEYVRDVTASPMLSRKSRIALGGIVPNLLRAPKAMPYADILASVREVRAAFADKELHVFGIGGTATLHLAAVLGIDSADSSGWRNRAARGIVQLPGGGDRVVVKMGSWRGRRPDENEWVRLRMCQCPACKAHGIDGLTASALFGFANRATHNLWILLEEANAIEEHIAAGTYGTWYTSHLDNSIYVPLVSHAMSLQLISIVDPGI